MSTCDDFIERLAAALEREQGREDFLDCLQNLTRDERAGLLAEADGGGPETEIN